MEQQTTHEAQWSLIQAWLAGFVLPTGKWEAVQDWLKRG